MGSHSARSTSHAHRTVGKGALTAAAALAVVGGSASMASAAELPSAPSAPTAPRVAKGNDVHLSEPDPSQGVAQAHKAPGHVDNGLQQINTGKLDSVGAPTGVPSSL